LTKKLLNIASDVKALARVFSLSPSFEYCVKPLKTNPAVFASCANVIL
jgi:hypothetical protein